MIAALLEMSVRGSLVWLVVLGLERLLGGRTQANWQRLWWLVVGLAFLSPVRWSFPVATFSSAAQEALPAADVWWATQAASVVAEGAPWAWSMAGIWLAGAVFAFAVLIVQTIRTARRWSGERLCTEPDLLELLEDCKGLARVRAPLGLVVSDEVASPAILGWLRPRILLPRAVASGFSREQLRHVFLHELAHFKAMDLPMGWVFALIRCVHWYNPCAYLAERGWARFREEAADEQVLRWQGDRSPSAYGETLIALLPSLPAVSVPGALALGETFSQLKNRILMITNYPRKNSRPFLILSAFLTLLAVALVTPVKADDKTNAVTAMEAWLKMIDAGEYAKSWQEASPDFRTVVTEEQWVQAMNAVRVPLGACSSRQLASALQQAEIPTGSGKMLKGDYVIAQFETSFANLKYALETVTFEKVDGVWRASGYFVKPRS